MSVKYTFVHDSTEVKMFYDLLPRLNRDEVYLMSLACRNKYLSDEEREYYTLGRNEMFSRKVVSEDSFEAYLRTVLSLEAASGAYVTKNGKNMPSKAMVVYAGLSPACGKNALKLFMEESMNKLFAYSEDSTVNFSHVVSDLNTCLQKSMTRGTFIDVDFDCPSSLDRKNFFDEFVNDFLSELRANNVRYYPVHTASGYHVLLNRDTLKYNYTVKVAELNRAVLKLGGEVVANSNRQLPLPGTLQAGHPVYFL